MEDLRGSGGSRERGVKGQEERTVPDRDDDMLFRKGRTEGCGVV
jgi:hypothetical protein